MTISLRTLVFIAGIVMVVGGVMIASQPAFYIGVACMVFAYIMAASTVGDWKEKAMVYAIIGAPTKTQNAYWEKIIQQNGLSAAPAIQAEIPSSQILFQGQDAQFLNEFREDSRSRLEHGFTSPESIYLGLISLWEEKERLSEQET